VNSVRRFDNLQANCQINIHQYEFFRYYKLLALYHFVKLKFVKCYLEANSSNLFPINISSYMVFVNNYNDSILSNVLISIRLQQQYISVVNTIAVCQLVDVSVCQLMCHYVRVTMCKCVSVLVCQCVGVSMC